MFAKHPICRDQEFIRVGNVDPACGGDSVVHDSWALAMFWVTRIVHQILRIPSQTLAATRFKEDLASHSQRPGPKEILSLTVMVRPIETCSVNDENSESHKGTDMFNHSDDGHYVNDDDNSVIQNGMFNVNCNPEFDGFEQDVLRHWCPHGRKDLVRRMRCKWVRPGKVRQ